MSFYILSLLRHDYKYIYSFALNLFFNENRIAQMDKIGL